ncbi:MAG: hypothetical protein FVQ82_03435 [Planctomycetes bacterium]|nr:hypothetical protein [Planctomycetota bacterium]
MINKKVSLGVDISGDCISYAVAAQEKSGVKIISAGKTQTPAGAIKDGNITDPAAIAKALRGLIGSKKYRGLKTTVSLTVSPSLAQIIELPDEMPDNVTNFVHSEIRHSAFLTGKDIQMDYCGLGLSAALPSKVFVSAVEKNKINPLLKTLKLAGIEPKTIEMPIAAWMRSVYEKHIKPRFKSNVMLVVVRDNVLNLCVFRKTAFDFVRRVDVTGLSAESCLSRCETEMKAIAQYYEIEFGGADEIAWDCVMELPSLEEHDKIQTSFSEVVGMNVHVCSCDSILSDTPVESKVEDMSVSLTAIGLALNPLKVLCPNVKTNLVPDEIKESQAAKRELLVFANAVAGILLAIFIFAGFAASQFDRTQEAVEERKEKIPLKRIESLVSRQKEIKEEIAILLEKKQLVDKVLEKSISVDWSVVLDEIRRNVPASLYITKVETKGDFDLVIKGKALKPAAVNLFCSHLDRSEIFASSNVKEIERKNSEEGIVFYTIKCTVADNRRLYAEAD